MKLNSMIKNKTNFVTYAVVIVGQLQTREHAPDQSGFAGAGLADNADQLVRGTQILLG